MIGIFNGKNKNLKSESNEEVKKVYMNFNFCEETKYIFSQMLNGEVVETLEESISKTNEKVLQEIIEEKVREETKWLKRKLTRVTEENEDKIEVLKMERDFLRENIVEILSELDYKIEFFKGKTTKETTEEGENTEEVDTIGIYDDGSLMKKGIISRLNRKGAYIAEINSGRGEDFNDILHEIEEAIFDEEFDGYKIIELTKVGYKINNKVIKQARVICSSVKGVEKWEE